jgi:ribosomal protein S1
MSDWAASCRSQLVSVPSSASIASASGSPYPSSAWAPTPWEQYVGRLETGQTVDATVTRATPSRAFARVADGVDGLIYVTELASERVGDPNDAVHACDVLPVRIVAIDRERRRLSLSARLAERT